MKYTQIPTDTFQKLQMNAGILVESFEPATGTIGRLMGATTGGISFNDNMSFKDLGESIDNCPKNMMQLKQLESHNVTMDGTFLTIDKNSATILAAVADIDPDDDTHIIPRNDLLDKDFTDVWWVGDYSNVNTGENAGFLAIHLMNALNTGGFSIASSDRDKNHFDFDFTGHYTMDAQDTVPYEIYIKAGTEEVKPSITLDTHSITLAEGDTKTFVTNVKPEGASVTWASSNSSVASVSNGVVTAVSEGNVIITASITVSGVTYNDTCTVIVTED